MALFSIVIDGVSFFSFAHLCFEVLGSVIAKYRAAIRRRKVSKCNNLFDSNNEGRLRLKCDMSNC